MIYIITILTIMLLCGLLLFVSRDIRNPANLFLFSWSAMLILLALGIINYIEVAYGVYAYIFTSIVIFSLFASVSSSIRLNSGIMVGRDVIDERPLVFLGFLGVASALAYYQLRFGISNLIFNPGFVRSQDDGGSGLFGILLFLPANIFVILGIRAYFTKKISFLSFVCLLVLFVYMLILPERTTLINSVAWLSFGIYALNPKKQLLSWQFLKKYVPIVLMGLIMFGGFFVIVSQRTGKIKYIDQISYAINQSFSVPKEIVEPYIYLTANIPALSAVFDSGEINESVEFNPSKTGIFINRVIQIFTKSDKAATSNAEFIEVPFRFNTYTWLYEPLVDYGLVGSFIYIALMGFVSGLTWSARKYYASPLTVYLYGGAATACIFTILTNKFSSIYFSYAIITVIALHFLFGRSIKAVRS